MKRFITSSLVGLLALATGMVFAVSPAAAASLHASTNDTYAALGDSVAAGFGLTSSSSDAVDVACARSSEAYPYAIAAALHLTLNHLACTGASTNQGVYGPQQVTPSLTLEPQIRQSFVHGTPKLITVTVGANDVHWNEFLNECYVTGCGSSQDNAQFEAMLLQLRVRLFVTLADIQLHSRSTPPHVVLTGYYSALSSAQPACTDTQGLTPADISWVNSKESELNNAIRGATTPFAFARYAPLNFTGHELCSAEPWVQGLSAPAPFHPTAAGQAAIAQNVLTDFGK